MKIIGITGGVGCGKTTVLDAIKKECNCRILLADDAAKLLEEPGEECYKKLVELLSENILDTDSRIIPGKMAAKIFGNDKLRQDVNDIIHPAVKDYILEQINIEDKRGAVDYFFLEAALLIECGYKSIVDEMWYIYADADVRYSRLRKQRGYSDEKTASIIKAQMSDEEYRAGSDVVIDNSTTIENTILQIRKALKR